MRAYPLTSGSRAWPGCCCWRCCPGGWGCRCCWPAAALLLIDVARLRGYAGMLRRALRWGLPGVVFALDRWLGGDALALTVAAGRRAGRIYLAGRAWRPGWIAIAIAVRWPTRRPRQWPNGRIWQWLRRGSASASSSWSRCTGICAIAPQSTGMARGQRSPSRSSCCRRRGRAGVAGGLQSARALVAHATPGPGCCCGTVIATGFTGCPVAACVGGMRSSRGCSARPRPCRSRCRQCSIAHELAPMPND